ncbi:hypothetical protein ABMB44_13565 [Levilactobacillus brevis]
MAQAVKPQIIHSDMGSVRKKYGKGRGKPVIGYSFAWKPERKDAEDVHVSKTERLKKAKIQYRAQWRTVRQRKMAGN